MANLQKCPRCKKEIDVSYFGLNRKKQPYKICVNCRSYAQLKRSESLKMKKEIDKEFLEQCEAEGIPVYCNSEYGMFGQLPASSDEEEWGGKND